VYRVSILIKIPKFHLPIMSASRVFAIKNSRLRTMLSVTYVVTCYALFHTWKCIQI